jgi:chromosomal replication initiator protein
LNPAYTFESFVRGDSNQFAHATCMAVADAPGQAYNPLFIYGSTGLGKTHLLHAVGHRILQCRPNAVITYISSERFMNEMIYCIRFNKMWDFRRKYRNCDVFLVDDIQFISGKERTQEEFFHTFNSLYEAKKQIVITSDLFPQDIPDIEDRLRNRFQWGLIADIQPPSIEHRVAILINKGASLGIQLSEEVSLYIANHAKRNVRELEGALHRIAAFAALQGRPIDLELASETFQNVLGEAPKRVTIELIQKTVAEHFKIRVTDLKSKKRQRALTIPRQIAMYLARVRTNASFPEIGTRFGGKDHTTVMHAVRKIELERVSDLDLKTSIEALERKIEQLC